MVEDGCPPAQLGQGTTRLMASTRLLTVIPGYNRRPLYDLGSFPTISPLHPAPNHSFRELAHPY